MKNYQFVTICILISGNVVSNIGNPILAGSLCMAALIVAVIGFVKSHKV